jgi:hypothetical protein
MSLSTTVIVNMHMAKNWILPESAISSRQILQLFQPVVPLLASPVPQRYLNIFYGTHLHISKLADSPGTSNNSWNKYLNFIKIDFQTQLLLQTKETLPYDTGTGSH